MSRHRIAQRGDIYWIDPNPVAERELKDRHRFVVITTKEINALGVVMTVPMTVPITGHDTTGVAVCNQVRSFDIEARVRTGNARYIETLDTVTAEEIVSRVISVIDPEQ